MERMEEEINGSGEYSGEPPLVTETPMLTLAVNEKVVPCKPALPIMTVDQFVDKYDIDIDGRVHTHDQLEAMLDTAAQILGRTFVGVYGLVNEFIDTEDGRKVVAVKKAYVIRPDIGVKGEGETPS